MGAYNENQKSWDIAPDGQHFLIHAVSADTPAPLTVVLNWRHLRISDRLNLTEGSQLL